MNTLKLLIGGFLIAHGLIHVLYGVPAPDENWPFKLDHSWLLSRFSVSETSLSALGKILWLSATVGFVLAGLGVFGIPLLERWWRTIAVASSAASLLLISLFWHRWFIVGLLLDVAIVVALLWIDWPPVELLGS